MVVFGTGVLCGHDGRYFVVMADTWKVNRPFCGQVRIYENCKITLLGA